MGVGIKRKEDPSSSNLGKEAEDFCFARISRTGSRSSGTKAKIGHLSLNHQ